MWVDPEGVEQATAEPVAQTQGRPVPMLAWSSTSARGSEVIRSPWPQRSNVSGGRSRSRDVPADPLQRGGVRRLRSRSWRSVPGPSTSRSPPAPGFISTPTAGHRPARRASRLVDYCPGPEFWSTVIARVPAGAIKLSPAADFSTHFAGSNVEIELISLRGECKEATVWFGELVSCRRRATRLPENVTWTDRDRSARTTFAAVAPPARLIYDPDPSLLRAGLLDGFACDHNLNRLAEGVDYLTATHWSRAPSSLPSEVREVCSLDLKALKRLIAKHEIGTLEIKVRGVDVTPEALRAKLKPRGTQAATLDSGRADSERPRPSWLKGFRPADWPVRQRRAEVATGSLSIGASEASPLPTAPAGSMRRRRLVGRSDPLADRRGRLTDVAAAAGTGALQTAS